MLLTGVAQVQGVYVHAAGLAECRGTVTGHRQQLRLTGAGGRAQSRRGRAVCFYALLLKLSQFIFLL